MEKKKNQNKKKKKKKRTRLGNSVCSKILWLLVAKMLYITDEDMI